METGENAGRKWRHARDGGWVSFDLKVLPDQPVALVCSYWGSETGRRTFDIFADGVRIGTQTLSNDKPGEFFDVTYTIPAEVTRGKTRSAFDFKRARRISPRWFLRRQSNQKTITRGLFYVGIPKPVRVIAVWILLAATALAAQSEKWSEQKARDWYARQPWLVGSNFNPASAINQLEM